eukprot:GHVR01185404.1.p1 GENE.GHVR01185404.1~~GHVR01185404.1.p1  ORF type:complete len:361 (-),score=51.49 GHVR01185404.1:2467-3549(-)
MNQKKHMLIHTDDISTIDEHSLIKLIAATGGGHSHSHAHILKQMTSRHAGGGIARGIQLEKQLFSQLQAAVIVDSREFNSSVPYQLYVKGLRLIPATIAVGDYILSRDLCVERKSIADLVQSFQSGRLYFQVLRMSRHYQCPVLLVDTEKTPSFRLMQRTQTRTLNVTTANTEEEETDATNLLQKIVLLSLHFPTLRFFWSPSGGFTAALFIALKAGREQPDLDRALQAGTIEEEPDANPNSVEDTSGVILPEGGAMKETPPLVGNTGSDATMAQSSTMSSTTMLSENAVSVHPDISQSTRTANISAEQSLVTADSAGNKSAVDLLRKLPGVTSSNATSLIRRVLYCYFFLFACLKRQKA